MKGIFAARSFVLLVAGAAVIGTLAVASPRSTAPTQTSLGFWEAAGRGLVTVVTVNETFTLYGHEVTQPAGIRVTNLAMVPVIIPEEAVLMSPHPSQSPPPNPLDTTADAALTNGTVPAHGSLLYSTAQFVLPGYLSGPIYWDLEEMQDAKAGVAFRVGGRPYRSRFGPSSSIPSTADPGTTRSTWFGPTCGRTRPSSSGSCRWSQRRTGMRARPCG